MYSSVFVWHEKRLLFINNKYLIFNLLFANQPVCIAFQTLSNKTLPPPY